MRVSVIVALSALAPTLLAQRTTGIDANSNTVVASVNPAGQISIISTIRAPVATTSVPVVATTSAAVVAPSTALPTTSRVVATTALATATSAAVTATRTTAPVQSIAPAGIVPPRVAGTQAPICSTPGCPVPPTLYTVIGGGSTRVMSFVATTPATPVPTVPRPGSVLALSSYITTTFTASSRLLSGGAMSAHLGSAGLSDMSVRVIVGGVGALVGALLVL